MRGSTCNHGDVLCGAACDGEDELHGEFGCALDLLRIDAALEAIAGVGVQAETAAGATDAWGIKVGALDEDVCGGLGDAGLFTTHDASDGDGSRGIGDDEVVG